MAEFSLPDPNDVDPYAYRWNVEGYERLCDVGLLDHVRTELLEGVIYVKWLRDTFGEEPEPSARPFVTNATRLVVAALREAYGPGFDVNSGLALKLSEHSLSKPDVTVLRGSAHDYDGREPDPGKDVALVVEIGEGHPTQDRLAQVRLYASHGVPEFWIVGLQDRSIQIRRRPRPAFGEYAETILAREGESVPAGDGDVFVSSVLPKAA